MDKLSFANLYLTNFEETIKGMNCFRNAEMITVSEGIAAGSEILEQATKEKRQVFFAGNGGSAGIASHMAVDFWKNGGVRATAFNDSSLLTCVANDYSFEEVFAKPIEMFANEGDIVICISSSGGSKNILNAADAAVKKGCIVLTFSGFTESNPLKEKGTLNFYVPSKSYGYVEILHNFIIHAILDCKLFVHDKKDVFNKNLPIDSNQTTK